MKSKLLEEKKRLTEELSGLYAHTELGDGQDENAEEIAVDEVSKNMIFRIKTDLGKIDKALAKIENGSYGVDDEGASIDEKRLRALPWADKAI
ncbi:MAG: hypothetical protein COT92_01715 [Candidatus Doudnabacteria bacterium CG10_big_fil_rev_8_21_14_0_10_42_18]|uniref:Uncharacterized protein n=1 Tax=Candidatus Doudnabacteria bacterium CG10_big_fil_rev_8_21_14_0_10_42_18 TaxID=1974552 RepID=A0A2H0VB66_9BACT|nr:MAG: hypothetical protein COT92_01715 [Candidatus Doudnabacteria bacterium CG10_big_fil_rev_8_21_14_0_10_42_18]